jgi:Cof subfamily protein (haloacid dehalogenase superfamily)
MGIFDGILICTDLDGTLYKNDKSVSKENLRAIEFFKEQGGYFTLITGRMPYYAGKALGLIQPNAPFGCINGGGLFDGNKGEYVWTEIMPAKVLELVRQIDENFDNIGIQVNTFHKTYFCRENKVMEVFRELTKLENLVCHYDDIKEPIAKIVFGIESEEQIESVEKMLKSHPLAHEFDFIRSEKYLYEILPKGIGKGTAIRKLCEHLNIDIKKSVAVGDYNNDISMLEAAGVGIAVSNACKNALVAADYITVSNEEHAIAQVIYDIEKGKFNL